MLSVCPSRPIFQVTRHCLSVKAIMSGNKRGKRGKVSDVDARQTCLGLCTSNRRLVNVHSSLVRLPRPRTDSAGSIHWRHYCLRFARPESNSSDVYFVASLHILRGRTWQDVSIIHRLVAQTAASQSLWPTIQPVRRSRCSWRSSVRHSKCTTRSHSPPTATRSTKCFRANTAGVARA